MPQTSQFSNIFLFADDAKLCKRIPQFNDSKLLQQDLDNLHDWSLQNILVSVFPSVFLLVSTVSTVQHILLTLNICHN